jgi:glycosyltransferase involved in cell wall biosynthesis
MHSGKAIIYQLNLSPSLGGAEVFTAFFSRALSALGWPTTIIAAGHADYWSRLDIGDGQVIRAASENEIISLIPAGATLVVHSSAPESLVRTLSNRTTLVALAHQALYNDKQPSYYRHAKLLVPVSRYVIETLRSKNYTQIFPLPLYGIGNIKESQSNRIQRGTLIDWDRRKFRDRLLSKLEHLSPFAQKHTVYAKRPGLTLGIVSRLAEAKQFPALFTHISERIRARPNVWLEVFGSAVGYRAFRDFRDAVAPIRERVRFWGMQTDVAAAYKNIDYLLTGLPERESFGLNVIEAQMCGTPVLAPKSLPFTETVIDNIGGYLYSDPRTDDGLDFARVLDMILKSDSRPDPRRDSEHLKQFEFPVFCHRVEQLMSFIDDGLAPPEAAPTTL